MNKIINFREDHFYLTDGGLETTLIFQEGIELNHFAAFELLNEAANRQVLLHYYQHYLELAIRFNTGFILETPTWRANPDWGFKLGYSQQEIRELIRKSVQFLRDLQAQEPYSRLNKLISGNMGPRGDGYNPATYMPPQQAQDYHLDQIQTFAKVGVDMVSAFTINYSDEALGIVRAAKLTGIPVVISYTLETDGRLPDGETLQEAIQKVDALTDTYTAYYMVNCAHPEHFKKMLQSDGKWKERIWGIRANASVKSHQELDESETLDTGDKDLLAAGYKELKKLLPNLRVIGGCCGTDHTHVEEVGKVLFEER